MKKIYFQIFLPLVNKGMQNLNKMSLTKYKASEIQENLFFDKYLLLWAKVVLVKILSLPFGFASKIYVKEIADIVTILSKPQKAGGE